MKNNYSRAIVIVLLVAVVTFTAHYLVLEGVDMGSLWNETPYSLGSLYLFQVVCSIIVAVVVLLAQWSMPKNLGFIFLGLILIKMVASYIYIQDGLGALPGKFVEFNFLASFFCFLFLDVYLAYQAINQGEERT